MVDIDNDTDSPFAGSRIDLSRLISAVQASTQAINNLNQTVSAVFPQGNAIASSAGASSGKYLTVIGTDGVAYKIALLANA